MAAAEECSHSSSLTWTAIANHLLSNHFLLSALELHLELAEVGKELPELRDFFSNPGNFERPIQLQALRTNASRNNEREDKRIASLFFSPHSSQCKHLDIRFNRRIAIFGRRSRRRRKNSRYDDTTAME